jgi:predicted HTH domain antitoxin
MKQQEVKNNNKVLVDAGLYESEENPEYKINLALQRYQNEDISIGKAAEIAGVCWEDMRDELVKNGINPRLAPRTIEEAQKDYHTIRKFLSERNRE